MSGVRVTFARLARMAANHPSATWSLEEDAILADIALSTLVAAAETAAAELIRAGRPNVANTLIAAAASFKSAPVSTDGILKGNDDLVPAAHQTLAAQPEPARPLKFDIAELIREPDDYTKGERTQAGAAVKALVEAAARVDALSIQSDAHKHLRTALAGVRWSA